MRNSYSDRIKQYDTILQGGEDSAWL